MTSPAAALAALIEELGEAKEGSRELDKQVALVLFGFDWTPEDGKPALGRYNWTRSLDTALTLPNISPKMRAAMLMITADECRLTDLDPAQHAARIYVLHALRARSPR